MESKKKNKIDIFNIINTVILTLAAVVTIYPLYYTIIASFSRGDDLVAGKVFFLPVNFTVKAYKMIPKIRYFFVDYGNTLFYTFFGMLLGVAVMSMGAYALSRPYLKGRHLISMLISFTMWFNAGMIPFYLNMDSLHLINKRWGLIFAFLCSPFYIIILRSYFESIPKELEEAAKMDGMGNFGIFTTIMLPLAKPSLLTIALYVAIDRWNGYFWAMILLKDENLAPVQVLLKKLIIENQMASAADGGLMDMSRESMIYAIIVVVIIPIVAIYPVIQKYFVKGVMVGAVKG
jgi:putative aldouronate transport system permease protein